MKVPAIAGGRMERGRSTAFIGTLLGGASPEHHVVVAKKGAGACTPLHHSISSTYLCPQHYGWIHVRPHSLLALLSGTRRSARDKHSVSARSYCIVYLIDGLFRILVQMSGVVDSTVMFVRGSYCCFPSSQRWAHSLRSFGTGDPHVTCACHGVCACRSN